MQVEFVLEKVHQRKMFTIRAYRIVFTDQSIYFIHLGEDASASPLGAGGGLAGALAQSIASKQSAKAMARAEELMSREGLDAAVAKDKRSRVARWSEIEGVESASYKWNRWPHLTFRIRGRGALKFTFDVTAEDHGEEERGACVEFMRSKVPNLVTDVP